MEGDKIIVPDFSEKQVSIIEAGEQLFALHGFDGTSVRDIAQQAGVNVAMISYYFGSKDKLLEAIISYRVSASAVVLENLLQNKILGPVEKIAALVEGYVDRMMEHPHYHKIIIREQMDANTGIVNSVISQSKLRNLELVKKLVGEGIRKKVFNKTVDIPLLMTTLFGTFYQVLSNSAFYKSASGYADLSEEAFQLILRKKLKAHLKLILISALTYEA